MIWKLSFVDLRLLFWRFCEIDADALLLRELRLKLLVRGTTGTLLTARHAKSKKTRPISKSHEANVVSRSRAPSPPPWPYERKETGFVPLNRLIRLMVFNCLISAQWTMIIYDHLWSLKNTKIQQRKIQKKYPENRRVSVFFAWQPAFRTDTQWQSSKICSKTQNVEHSKHGFALPLRRMLHF